MRSLCALLLALVCLPAFAAGDCATIESLNAADVQTGQVVVIEWTYSGGVPQSQILTGHDFPEPIVIPPGQTYYTYLAKKPGEKHAQLSAITECGTATRTLKYHVKKCNLVMPELTTSASTIEPGQTFTASVALAPGHTATWEVTGGTVSSTTGASIQITAGDTEYVAVNVMVTRGKCSEWNGTIVPIVGRCAIGEPQIFAPDFAPAGGYFSVYVPERAGETTTLVPHGAAQVYYNDGIFLDMVAPATGSFSVDVVVSNGTCERTFTRTWTVGACNPTATVTAGEQSGSCGANVAVVEFTGTAPWQGYWNDNEYFFTYEPRIERALTTPGTYSVTAVWDQYCQGTTSGSVTAGASFPQPAFTIDPIVNGYWYDTATCPGMERVARLDVAIPAGAQVEWTVENATILSGQGTSELHFAATAVGPVPVTAVFRDAQGCSQSYTFEYMLAYGTPQFEVTVEPSTIPLGGTAIITVRQLVPFTGGTNVTSSLGDTIVPRGGTGDTATWEYRSTRGSGTATITVTETNTCLVVTTGEVSLTIDAGDPIPAGATVRASGTDCDTYMVVADFTGVSPFRGTVLRDGEFYTSFYTDFPSMSLRPAQSGTYTVVDFFDGTNAPGAPVTGSATFDFTPMPTPAFSFDTPAICLNGTATATLDTPIPDGGSVTWTAYGATIVSGQGTASVVIRADNPYVSLSATFSGPNACDSTGWSSIAPGAEPMAPWFDVYGTYAGEWTQFLVTLDNATETWGFENSLGDPMEIISEPWPDTYILGYTSTHGPGSSDIRIYSTNICGVTTETTRTMQIQPARATATLTSTPDPVCGAILTVTFTGVAPFTGTWSDTGETFTTNESTYTRHVATSGDFGVGVWSVSDANGPGFGSEWVWVQGTYAPYVYPTGTSQMCAGTTATATATVLDGFEVIWTIEGTNGHIVSGQGTGEVVVAADAPGQFLLMARYRTPAGCEGSGSGYTVTVPETCP